MNFAIDFTQALAWPLTVVVLVLLFKNEIRAVLNKLEKVRVRDIVAEFTDITTKQDEEEIIEDPPEQSQPGDDAQSTDSPGYNPQLNVKRTIDLLRLELGGSFVESVGLFKRPDLVFDGAAIAGDKFYVIEVLDLGTSDSYPSQRVQEVLGRVEEAEKEAQIQGYQPRLHLILTVISALPNEQRATLTNKLRHRFMYESRRSVRVYTPEQLIPSTGGDAEAD